MTPPRDPGISDATSKALTYSDYLAVEELLRLQRPLSDPAEHDEMLFIIIHQAYELWFKQILVEFDFFVVSLRRNDRAQAMATLKRILTILKVLVHQIDILETMTPVSFASFRARLETASGFQSAQFREVEIVLGARNERSLEPFPADSDVGQRLRRRYHQPALWTEICSYLARCGHDVPETVLEVAADRPIGSDSAMQETLLHVYREDSDHRDLCERLVDLDEGLQEWRYRHVKMVERTIGDQPGTGGSPGVSYLKKTLFQPVFPDLWAIRSRL